MEQLKVEIQWTKNIYFWDHTLTDWKTNSWIGKSMVQTTPKMIFTNLNSFFVKKLYVLVLTLENNFFCVIIFLSLHQLANSNQQVWKGNYISFLQLCLLYYLGNGSIWFSNFPKKVLYVSRTPKRTAF